MKLKTYLAENNIKNKDLPKKIKKIGGPKSEVLIVESTVTRMIKRGAIVINGVIYTPQYEIKK